MDAPPIQYVQPTDGISIAYCVSGTGPPLVHLPFVFNHLQIHWRPTSMLRPWYEALAGRFRLIQYDARGMGLSTRNLAPEQYLPAAQFSDLERLIDELALEEVILLGAAGPATFAIEYGLRHPHRVAAIILSSPIGGGPAANSISWDLATEDWELFLATHAGGGVDLDARERKLRIEELRQTVTQADWVNLGEGLRLSGVRNTWPEQSKRWSKLSVPTLVVYPRDLRIMRIENSQTVAATIPGARLAIVDGQAIPGDVDQVIKSIDEFLAALPPRHAKAESEGLAAGLSGREVEVLRLVAAGKSNQQIADVLVLSVNTVIRHVSNIYAKTGTANRAEATAFAARRGLL